MPSPADAPSPRPRLLLVGAGHAHLGVIGRCRALEAADLTLIDPGGFWYSGMANGVLGGALPAAANRLDPVRVAARHGITAIRGRLAGLDLVAREVLLEDGRRFGFELLSLNLGSRAITPAPRDPGPEVWAVKPIAELLRLRRRLEAQYRRGERPAQVVVGGGASGVEVACNLQALARRHGLRPAITLVTAAERLVADGPRGASRWLARHLARRGIRVLTEARVTGHVGGGATLQTDSTLTGEDSLQLIEAEHVVHATGLAPPAVVERLGLPLIAGRGLAVQASLQSVADPDIFAAGDCAAMVDHVLPRLGVYGVRQGPVLADNLAARLHGTALHDYVPQPRALAILDLGDGNALAIRGRRWWAGRTALLAKRWLDGRFLASLRRGR